MITVERQKSFGMKKAEADGPHVHAYPEETKILQQTGEDGGYRSSKFD